MNKPFSKKTTIIILIALAFLTAGLSYGLLILSQKDNLSWDSIINHITKKPNNSQEIDTSEWKTYDEDKQGIKAGILSNFIFPNDWFTYNFAGGSVVKIIFSDGGNLINAGMSEKENIERLYLNDLDSGQKINNECRIEIKYDGFNNSYNVNKYNSKLDLEIKENCDDIISILEYQILKK